MLPGGNRRVGFAPGPERPGLSVVLTGQQVRRGRIRQGEEGEDEGGQEQAWPAREETRAAGTAASAVGHGCFLL